MSSPDSSARRRQSFFVVRTLLNPLAKGILRSPLHGFMSHRLLLITFIGHKSGKRFTTPISYVQRGTTLLLGVGGPWWKNLRGGAEVGIRLRGKTYTGQAEAWNDAASMARIYQVILTQNPVQAQFMGINAMADGHPDQAAMQRALQRGAAVVEIHLSEKG